MSLKQYQAELVDFFSKPDPRVAKWPLMDSPWITVSLVAFYIAFVKIIGPAWMKNKKPFDLKLPMIVYNLFQVGICAWIFIQIGRLGWFTKYNWRCEPIDFSYRYEAIRMSEICWICFMVKFLEFIDTIFFVLRKKNAHISVLHVFHHSFVPLTVWIGIKYGAGGYNTIFPFLNTFVHVWMYLYYGLSAFGPSIQKYLWWKKYLTTLQMVQFIIVFVYLVQLYFFPTCKVSKILVSINIFMAVVFFLMFWNFYYNSYRRKKKPLENIINELESEVNNVIQSMKKSK